MPEYEEYQESENTPNTTSADTSEEQRQQYVEQLRSLQQIRIQHTSEALDSCINASAATRKAFADIIKLGNQIDIEYYRTFINSIESLDALVNHLPKLIKAEVGRTIL